MLFKKLLISNLINFSFISLANSTCYTVHDASNQIIYRSIHAPIDLSGNLQAQIKNQFGNGSHMIFSDANSFAECSEINIATITKNKAESQELEKLSLQRKQEEEKARKSMDFARREEEIRLYIERKYIEKQNKRNYEVMVATSGMPYEKELEDKLKSNVLDQLKDPESARFKNLKIIGYGTALCGLVNAKNSFGGYVGFQKFVSDNEGAYIRSESTRIDSLERLRANQLYFKKAMVYGCA